MGKLIHQTIYESITKVLRDDDDLKVMVDYSVKKNNIRRAFVAKDGDWDSLIIYYMQTQDVKTDFTPQIRDIPLIVRVYDKNDDLQVEDICERVILLLEGTDLSVSGKIHCYDCSFTNDLISTSWSKETKSYEKAIRFTLTIRVDGIIGNSGMPSNRRQHEW